MIDVTYTIDTFTEWMPAEKMVDELNGDAGKPVAWIVETYTDRGGSTVDKLLVLWEQEGDIPTRNRTLDDRFGHDQWEVKYP